MSTPTRPPSRYAAEPRPGEALLQSAGYTHLLLVGQAKDLPTLSASPVWRKASQLQETIGSVSHYLFSRGGSNSGLNNEDEVALTDSKTPTSLVFLGVQQVLSGRIPENLSMLRNILSSVGKPLDDRKMQLEDVVGWLATSGRKNQYAPNKIVNDVQGQFIDILWNDLSHPSSVDLNPKHRFRTPDGRNNNIIGSPFLGAANQPYARSVKALHPRAPYIAEPEDMFDSILRRPEGFEGFVPHPAGVSSLLFGFANIIIHDIFWTNNGPEVKGPGSDTYSGQYSDSTSGSSRHSQWQNLTSSYLSLDPLYGVGQEEQDKIRNKDDLGRGLLYNDTFASSRLLMMPPASCALLVIFSRNHNRIAKKLLEINERGSWTADLEKLSPEQLQQQDDEIFGTARLINCGYYVEMILHDYLSAILNTTQADSDWALDPRPPIKSILGSTPKATGNSVTVEFNSLYRWHAPMSWSQSKWIEDMFERALPSKKWEDVNHETIQKSAALLKKELNAEEGVEPRYWKLSKYEVNVPRNGQPELTSAGVYERDSETGEFRDEDIAKILKDSTYEVAGTFGARHIPAAMRWIECQGMRTSRDVWKTCTLNEFRAFLGLKEFETFEEWNSDPSVASAMQDLVGHPANIPLHVGLHGEEAKKPRLGAGLCPNYTNSRAILSDAVSLVRGDRFYTDSATADTMTDWGLRDCQPDVQEGAYGGMLQRMIRNNLPDQYVFNDVALLFPFKTPQSSYSILEKIGPQKALQYSLQPTPTPHLSLGYKHMQSGGKTIVYEISDTPKVEVERMSLLFGLPQMNSNIKLVYQAVEMVMSKQNPEQYKLFIQSRIQQCSARRSPVSTDETVDITRDVTNPLICGWLSHIFGLVETGIHSQQLLLCALSDIYCYLNAHDQISFKSRAAARVAASGFAWQIQQHIEASYPPNSIGKLIRRGVSTLTIGALDVLEDSIKTISGQRLDIKHSSPDTKLFYDTLRVENDAQRIPLSTDELTADCLRAVSTLAYTIVNGTAHALDYLMPAATTQADEIPKLRQTLHDLVYNPRFDRSNIHEAHLKHGLEGVRLAHWNPYLCAVSFGIKLEHRAHPRPIGIIDREFRLDRNTADYLRLLDVEGYCLPMFEIILPVIINQVFSLNKVQRAPGLQGMLEKIMITGSSSSIPTMHIRYDGAKTLKAINNSRARRMNGYA